MKKFNFKWLLLSIILSIASINTAWAETLVLKTDVWNTGSAWFAAVFMDADKSVQTWVQMDQIGSSEYYSVDVPADQAYVIFVRMNKDKKLSDKWDGKWDQSSDLTLGGSKVYNITGWGTGSVATGSWGNSLYTKDAVIYLRVPSAWQVSSAKMVVNFTIDGIYISNTVGEQVGETQFYKVTIPNKYTSQVQILRYNSGVTEYWGGKTNMSNAPTDNNNCIYNNSSIVGENQEVNWTKYAPSPAVWFNDENDYTTHKFVDGSVGISLSANTTYYFKVADGVEGEWWGYANNDTYRKSFVGQSEKHTLYQGGIDDQKVLILKTAGAGTYTFNWNSSTQKISVTYPLVTHPSSDYIYFKNNLKWKDVMAHLFGGTPASTGWDALPVLDSINFDGKYYHYAADGGSTSILVAKETTTNDELKTADLTVSKGKGKWYDVVSKSTSSSEVDANWKDFTATLTLTHQIATNSPTPASITVTYNADANLTGDVLTKKPTNANYAFQGYYTGEGGSGSLLINTSGAVQNVTNYTSSGKWIRTSSAEVFAKWTQSVTLDDNGAYDGNGSLTATYNAAGPFSITTAPRREGYVVEGYYADEECTHKVMTNTGALVNYTDYVSGGKWVHDAATTLYAKWAEDDITVTVNAGAHGEVSTTSVTGHPETASSSFTVTAAAGYAFSHWTYSEDGKATVSYVSTGGTNNATQTFTLTTKKAITITANYVVRYGLYGSLDTEESGNEYGMPGWSVSQSFEYSAGNYSTSVTLTRPNTNYKFRILDRRDNTSWGLASKSVIPASTATTLGSIVADALLATAGTGSYTLAVVEADEGAHPRLTITNAPSYQVTYGHNTGGSVTSVVDGEGFDIASGQYVKEGGSVTYTAKAETGYEFVGWCTNESYGETFTTYNPWTNSSISAASIAYAKFVPVTLTFEGDETGHETEWNLAGNWSPAKVPTIDHDVVLAKPVTVNVANAKAKSVVIDQYSGNTGKLTVGAGKALVVATTIQKKNAGGSTVATEETDIVLESDGSNGTGALVAGSESHNTKATVQFYSKAKYDEDRGYGYVNQYFGIPVDSVSKLAYYGSYLRKFDVENDAWASFSESKMYGFTAYRIMREETSEGTYEVGGTLILPGTSKDTVLTIEMTSHSNDNMFANSWTAPIDVTQFDVENDFDGAIATIYVFNAGAKGEGSNTSADKNAGAGNWTSMPVAAVKAAVAADPDQTTYDLTQIPSQQAFLIQGNEGSKHQIKLNYKALVYDPIAENGATIVPARAPKRTMETEVELMQLNLTADESGLSDRVLLYVSNDFSTDEMDNGWEAYKLPGEAFAPQFCANTPLGEMSISATKDIEGTVLGFYAGTKDDHYTFSFDYNGEGTWYLNDLDENESTVIDSANEYQFTATKGTVAEKRFTISKSPISKTPTGIEDVNGEVNARKLMMNGTLYIIRDGKVYDAEGSLVK